MIVCVICESYSHADCYGITDISIQHVCSLPLCLPVSLAVDASDTHIGAVLQQKLQGSWSPLAFFSKKLSSAKSKYSAFDRELLAAYSAICHFRFLLEGRSFTLFTDHKPLTNALSAR